MSPVSLVRINLFRNTRRTFLTTMSVVVALFLFCSLQGVLDTLHDAMQVGSETRLVTRNAISLVFPLPLAYRDRLAAMPGVESVTWSNWFGGSYPQNKRQFFAKFAVDGASYFPMYAGDFAIVAADRAPAGTPVPPGADPKLAAFFADQTGAVVGEGLMKKLGWRLGQTVTLQGDIYPGSWPLTIRAVYRPLTRSFNDETLVFHWKYLSQKTSMNMVGTYALKLAQPSRAAEIAKTVDATFENSPAATRTETEKAFQAGFVSMYGNIPFVLRLIGLAVAFAILLVAANTMMMAVRERVNEFAVLKTLGFDDGQVFRLVLAEGAIITLGGGLVGALAAKFLIEASHFNAAGALPPMSVHWSTVILGVGIAVLMGAASGAVPAWQASRLRIVDALRRVQ